VFTPTIQRKPLTPLALRRDTLVKKTSSGSLYIKQMNGTLLAAFVEDAKKMAIAPAHRADWDDIQLKSEIVRPFFVFFFFSSLFFTGRRGVCDCVRGIMEARGGQCRSGRERDEV
jgi:hypothetical protein